ncbi:hypothetical protein Pcaca03_18400 [Pectobacterium carotovorum subsp. carotovorum]|uniref:Cytoplasmic protein n=1 Tax=Pectobacterium carotovorum subsp. carotovorum TaxID=555 RepID=A0AAI9PE08_PECCC|nr:hypothetical protein SOASR016_17020 [Pectobacterium carotovorum subsp. carotovorum]GLV69396.1 hypothetical protein Pcaca03_18400 [Pectobacterium carotovorum subsp. carotovorum]
MAALADLYRVIKREMYATPDDMKKRFPSLDRMKYREKWWVIDIGGGHLRVMFFADFERGKSSSSTSHPMQSMTG